MRPLGFALTFLVGILITAAAATTALAASTPAAAPITKEQKQKGMEAAPGLVTEANLDCKVSDARLIGQTTDPKTKIANSFYEVACEGNEGLIIQKPVGQPANVFTCEEADTPQADGKANSVKCVLPGNADPKAGLKPYIAKAGMVCNPEKMRAIGHNTSITAFEVACSGGQDYIMQTSSPLRLDKPVTMVPCLALPADSTIQCTLIDRATQLAFVDKLVTQSGKPCAVKDRRYIGASPTTGDSYYEVACQDGKGYVLQTAANGSYKAAVDCAAAEGIGGGCTLTNARAAETQQAGLYSQLARKAGFNCDVTKYAPLPADVAGKEIVELVCSTTRRGDRRVRRGRRRRHRKSSTAPIPSWSVSAARSPGLGLLRQPHRSAEIPGKDDLRGVQRAGGGDNRRQARLHRSGLRRRPARFHDPVHADADDRQVGAAVQPEPAAASPAAAG